MGEIYEKEEQAGLGGESPRRKSPKNRPVKAGWESARRERGTQGGRKKGAGERRGETSMGEALSSLIGDSGKILVWLNCSGEVGRRGK